MIINTMHRTDELVLYFTRPKHKDRQRLTVRHLGLVLLARIIRQHLIFLIVQTFKLPRVTIIFDMVFLVQHIL